MITSGSNSYLEIYLDVDIITQDLLCSLFIWYFSILLFSTCQGFVSFLNAHNLCLLSGSVGPYTFSLINDVAECKSNKRHRDF